jgi:hypothetical protein
MEIALRHETAEAIRVKPADAETLTSSRTDEVADLVEAAR